METARRKHGKTYKGHTIPYGTLADASQALISAYYANGYLHDEDMPEMPCPPAEYKEYVDPEEELHKKEMVAVVQDVLEGLTPRETKILYVRFGIGLTQDYTLEEVGAMFDVSKERIRQIEAKAMRKIKHPKRSDKLRELIGYYQTTAQKEAEAKKIRAQWQRARENKRLRDEAEKRYKKERERELERVYKEDLRLRAKWEEIKPMVSDADWIEHLKTKNPEMYAELKYLVGDIWGYNADKVWEMYAEKK
jgi:RNA polymerase sigma factor (sigma-70 family)